MRKIAHPVVMLVVLVLGGVCGWARPAGDDALEVTVVGQAAGAYRRQKLPDGTLKPESYAIARGGMVPGTTWDESVDLVRFPVIATVLNRHLARQNYIMATKLDDRDLLIVVHWGSTLGYEGSNYSQSITRVANAVGVMNATAIRQDAMKRDAQGGTIDEADLLAGDRQRASDHLESALTMIGLENKARDMANLGNAKLLGYLDAINARRDMLFSEINGMSHDLMRDVEERRYYVVVSAYDFRAARDEKKQVLRWVTRISIRASGNSFDERMAQMIAAGAGAFGRRTELSRRFYRDPRVELGEVEYLGLAAPGTPETDAETGETKEN